VEISRYGSPSSLSHTTQATLCDFHNLKHYLYWNVLGLFFSSSMGDNSFMVQISKKIELFYNIFWINWIFKTILKFICRGKWRPHPSLKINFKILLKFNEFIKFSTEIGICPSCIVHPWPIHLWTSTNNFKGLNNLFNNLINKW